MGYATFTPNSSLCHPASWGTAPAWSRSQPGAPTRPGSWPGATPHPEPQWQEAKSLSRWARGGSQKWGGGSKGAAPWMQNFEVRRRQELSECPGLQPAPTPLSKRPPVAPPPPGRGLIPPTRAQSCSCVCHCGRQAAWPQGLGLYSDGRERCDQ